MSQSNLQALQSSSVMAPKAATTEQRALSSSFANALAAPTEQEGGRGQRKKFRLTASGDKVRPSEPVDEGADSGADSGACRYVRQASKSPTKQTASLSPSQTKPAAVASPMKVQSSGNRAVPTTTSLRGCVEPFQP